MSLSPGTRIGAYEVVAQLGAGGMGEVYRAHDTKLNRDVAIKVLAELVATDPAARRFCFRPRYSAAVRR
jgi:eukaryotic-like serine/threonine-protein kinase